MIFVVSASVMDVCAYTARWDADSRIVRQPLLVSARYAYSEMNSTLRQRHTFATRERSGQFGEIADLFLPHQNRRIVSVHVILREVHARGLAQRPINPAQRVESLRGPDVVAGPLPPH